MLINNNIQDCLSVVLLFHSVMGLSVVFSKLKVCGSNCILFPPLLGGWGIGGVVFTCGFEAAEEGGGTFSDCFSSWRNFFKADAMLGQHLHILQFQFAQILGKFYPSFTKWNFRCIHMIHFKPLSDWSWWWNPFFLAKNWIFKLWFLF